MEERTELLLQLLASLTLCDHMGDVSDDVSIVLERLNIELDDEDDDSDDWGASLRKKLHSMGITTLVGTSLG